mgnify:CR=1 FL=1
MTESVKDEIVIEDTVVVIKEIESELLKSFKDFIKILCFVSFILTNI